MRASRAEARSRTRRNAAAPPSTSATWWLEERRLPECGRPTTGLPGYDFFSLCEASKHSAFGQFKQYSFLDQRAARALDDALERIAENGSVYHGARDVECSYDGPGCGLFVRATSRHRAHVEELVERRAVPRGLLESYRSLAWFFEASELNEVTVRWSRKYIVVEPHYEPFDPERQELYEDLSAQEIAAYAGMTTRRGLRRSSEAYRTLKSLYDIKRKQLLPQADAAYRYYASENFRFAEFLRFLSEHPEPPRFHANGRFSYEDDCGLCGSGAPCGSEDQDGNSDH